MSDSDSTPAETGVSSPEVSFQATFTDDGVAVDDTATVETSLDDYGADLDHRDPDPQIESPTASEFGVDDRPTTTSTDAGEQQPLFASTHENQQTLAGEYAGLQFLFDD